MTTPQDSWAGVSDRIEALALKLKLHLEQSRSDEVPQALGQLGRALEDAFQAAGNAVKDEAVRADVREVGQLVVDALSSTLANVSEDVREAFAHKQRDA